MTLAEAIEVLASTIAVGIGVIVTIVAIQGRTRSSNTLRGATMRERVDYDTFRDAIVRDGEDTFSFYDNTITVETFGDYLRDLGYDEQTDVGWGGPELSALDV